MISGSKFKILCDYTVVTVQRIVEISWKRSYGNCVQAPHGVIFPRNFVLCKLLTIALIVGQASKGLWDKFFLDYEASWIKNGYSLTEATYACINMQVELGMVSKEQLDNHAVDEQQKYILQPTRMDYRLILKSLRVTSTTVKLQNN